MMSPPRRNSSFRNPINGVYAGAPSGPRADRMNHRILPSDQLTQLSMDDTRSQLHFFGSTSRAPTDASLSPRMAPEPLNLIDLDHGSETTNTMQQRITVDLLSGDFPGAAGPIPTTPSMSSPENNSIVNNGLHELIPVFGGSNTHSGVGKRSDINSSAGERLKVKAEIDTRPPQTEPIWGGELTTHGTAPARKATDFLMTEKTVPQEHTIATHRPSNSEVNPAMQDAPGPDARTIMELLFKVPEARDPDTIKAIMKLKKALDQVSMSDSQDVSASDSNGGGVSPLTSNAAPVHSNQPIVQSPRQAAAAYPISKPVVANTVSVPTNADINTTDESMDVAWPQPLGYGSRSNTKDPGDDSTQSSVLSFAPPPPPLLPLPLVFTAHFPESSML